MSPDEAEEFMHEWGDWAKWSDARAMVQEAFARGYTAGLEQGKKDALNAHGVEATMADDFYALQERYDFVLAACRDAQEMAARYGWALHAIAQGVADPVQAARDAMLGAALERTRGTDLGQAHSSDTARIDWLEQHADEAVFDGPTEADCRFKVNTGKGPVCGATLREAIDNARGEGAAPATRVPGAELPDFAAVWQQKYEWDGKRGYRYGRDALEQVKFGYEIARCVLIESSRTGGVAGTSAPRRPGPPPSRLVREDAHVPKPAAPGLAPAHEDWTDDAACLSGLADRLEQESADESERGNDSTACAWSCRAYELRQIVSRMVRTRGVNGGQAPSTKES